MICTRVDGAASARTLDCVRMKGTSGRNRGSWIKAIPNRIRFYSPTSAAVIRQAEFIDF